MSDSSQPHGLQPTRLLRPWDFPGKSTGVGCHQATHVQFLGRELRSLFRTAHCCLPEISFFGASVSGGTSGKEPTCQFRRGRRLGFDPCVRKILWRKAWQPTPVFLPGESHRSLAGYSLCGHKESDMTEPLSTLQITISSILIYLYPHLFKDL